MSAAGDRNGVREAAFVRWAIVRQGRTRREDVLVILDDRAVADSMATELRGRGQSVDVVGYMNGGVITLEALPGARRTEDRPRRPS